MHDWRMHCDLYNCMVVTLHCLKNLYIYGTTLIIAEGNVP